MKKFDHDHPPPYGESLVLFSPAGDVVAWNGKRWYDPRETDGSLQTQDCWPPPDGGPWYDVHTLDIPLADRLGLPVTPTYGSRYEPNFLSYTYTQSWTCRTCGGRVTDRYAHELEHRANSWVKDIDKLYDTVAILFGGG